MRRGDMRDRAETIRLIRPATCRTCGQHLPAGTRIPPRGHLTCPRAQHREEALYARGRPVSLERRAAYDGECIVCGAPFEKGETLVPVKGPHGKWMPAHCSCRRES